MAAARRLDAPHGFMNMIMTIPSEGVHDLLLDSHLLRRALDLGQQDGGSLRYGYTLRCT